MPDTTLLTRAARSLADDSDLREDILDAFRTSKRAVLRPAPKPTRLRRAGNALQSVGSVISRTGAKAEARRRAERRARALRAVVVGGGAAAVAAAGLARRQSASTSNGGPHV